MTYTEHPKFTGRNVPIMEIARATGKNPQFIRIGLQRGLEMCRNVFTPTELLKVCGRRLKR